MIALSPRDQQRVDEWLAAHGYDLDNLSETGRPMTPCRRNFIDLRVALHLSGRLTERLTRKSIRSAIRRDVKWFDRKDKLEFELPAWDSENVGKVMKIREDDALFTVDVPLLRIRPCTPAEAAASARRWVQSKNSTLRRRLNAAAKAGSRPDDADAWSEDQAHTAEGGQQVPWRELAGGWQRILTGGGTPGVPPRRDELASLLDRPWRAGATAPSSPAAARRNRIVAI